jgi:arylsulfatase A-like enzyme
MYTESKTYLSTLVSLWFRLITLAIVAFVFCEALELAQGQAQGWSYYLTSWEVSFEIVIRLVAAALLGVALGTVVTAIVSPFLYFGKAQRAALTDAVTRLAAILVVLLMARYSLQALLRWSYVWFHRGAAFDRVIWIAFYLAFAIALCFPRTRKEVATSLDGFLTTKMTRRTAIATLAGTVVVVGTEYALSNKLPAIRAASSGERPKTNFVLVTFDALSAEDMSLYGYRLATTPNIDSFARKATVFSNFYSVSTFTTPCIAGMLTGLYPSESSVYQLQGQLREASKSNSLPHLLKAGGYSTGAFLSNPFAYYFGKNLQRDFDIMPEPVFQKGAMQQLWDTTAALHQETGIGSRIDEYRDLEAMWNSLINAPRDLSGRYRAADSFQHAQEALDMLQEGFFLWVHVMTPHYPYLPDAADRGRFSGNTKTASLDNDNDRLWYPNYPPEKQSAVDQRRHRYDEFIATADRSFGSFMTNLERSGRLENTTVIVSADHGESFEGGVYRHESPYQTRPVIHVPLIIRTPSQQEGHSVDVTADQTALAPTILELAGQTKPDSMRARSLAGWLDGRGGGQNEGWAFGQYFERNSVFKPVRRGSIGVIDGQFQYVLYLDSRKGVLRPLNEAQVWDLDRSAEHPERATALRQAIQSRFPEIAS